MLFWGKHFKKTMSINNVTDLLSAMSKNKIYVFGTGFVCKKFLSALKTVGYERYVKGFIVTFLRSVNIMDGIPVRLINDDALDRSRLVCIAVHESLKNEIVQELEKYGFSNYVWIYPLLFDLAFGKPIAVKKEVPLKEIYLAMREYYHVFVRYLMIEQYYGRNTYGQNIYIKAFNLINSHKTAEIRLGQFLEVIKNFELKGYNKNCPSGMLENFEIFDGSHRFALNIYHKNDTLSCNVYKGIKNVLEWLGKEVLLTEDVLPDLFSCDEIALLKDVRLRLDRQFEI